MRALKEVGGEEVELESPNQGTKLSRSERPLFLNLSYKVEGDG